MPEKNDDVFDIEINYSSTGDDKTLRTAGDIDDALESIKENSLLDLELSIDGDNDLYDVADEIDRLNGETIDTNVNVNQSELLDADRLLDNLNDDPSATVTVDDDQLQEANDKLDVIKNFEILNFVWNIAGTAVDFFKSTADFTVGPILEYDTALSTIQARTGKMIPDARELISDLYTDGWGESRQQIADVITLATQLGVEQDHLKEATQAAYEVSAVTGDDTQTSLRTIINLSHSMGISYSDAADLVVAGSQEGANAAGDLSQALIEFGPKLDQMGISGEGALSIIKSGLANGAKDASTLVDGIKELGINIGKIGTDQDVTAAFNKLDSLSTIDLKGQLDLYKQGKLSGDDFYQGIFDALNEVGTNNPQAAQQIGDSLIGSKSEDLGAGVFANLETSFDDSMQTIEGRAATAGTTIHDNIASKFTELERSIGDAIATYLEDNTQVDTFLDNFKQGIQDTLDALKQGKDVGEAITIGLKPLGFDDEFQKLESIFGNLIIGFLQIVADIQDALGKDSTGTRQTLATQAGQQLAFDLKVANPEDIANTIQTAVDRGVDPAEITKQAGTAIKELTQSGDIEKAQQLVDTLKQGGSINFSVTDPVARKILEDQGQNADFSVPISPEMTPEDVEKYKNDIIDQFKQNGFSLDANIIPTLSQGDLDNLQQQIDRAGGDTLVKKSTTGGSNALLDDIAKSDASTALDDVASAVQDLTPTARDAEQADQNRKDTLVELKDTTDDATISVDTMNQTTQDYTTAAGDAALANSDLASSMSDSIAKYQELEAKLAAGQITLDQFNQSVDALIQTIQNSGGGSGTGGTGTGTSGSSTQTVTSDVNTNFDDVSGSAQQMDATVQTSTANISQAVNDMDDAITNSISGNSVIPEFEALSASASSELPYVVDQLEAVNATTFTDVESEVENLISLFEQLQTAVTSVDVESAISGASAAGSTNVNNTNTVTVNQTNNVQSNAQAGTVGAVTGDLVKGLP